MQAVGDSRTVGVRLIRLASKDVATILTTTLANTTPENVTADPAVTGARELCAGAYWKWRSARTAECYSRVPRQVQARCEAAICRTVQVNSEKRGVLAPTGT